MVHSGGVKWYKPCHDSYMLRQQRDQYASNVQMKNNILSKFIALKKNVALNFSDFDLVWTNHKQIVECIGMVKLWRRRKQIML